MGQARQSASTKLRAKLSAAIAAQEKREQEWHSLHVELLDDARMSKSAWIEATYEAQQSAARVVDQCTKLHAQNKALRTLSAMLLAGIAIIGTGALFLL